MPASLTVDADQLGATGASWSNLIENLNGSPPSSAGSWPSTVGAQTMTATAGDATAALQTRLTGTAESTQKAAADYRDIEDHNAGTLVDFKGAGDKKHINDLLAKVHVIADEPSLPGYQRRRFGQPWRDPAHPGLVDTRDRILERDLNDVTTAPGGQVIGGWETDPYSGQRITADQTQIDHVYPLRRAWDSGAANWTPQQRITFANDPDNLLAVSGSANESKGDQGPAQWLPPNQGEHLDYEERYLNVAVKYDLPITQAEYDTIATEAK